jgi:hypothetical protein
MVDFISTTFYAMAMIFRLSVTLLHWRPLQNATISNIKSDNCKAVKKRLKGIVSWDYPFKAL